MKQDTAKLDRIYQGRVIHVSIEDDNGNITPAENGIELLYQHHRLFQDAVNYYLVALTAMSLKDSDSLFGKLRIQLKSIWNDFFRNGELRPGLKHSMIRTLGHADLLDQDDGAENAMKIILDGNESAPELLNRALELIAEKCKDNVKKPHRTYYPRLCEVEYKGNYDCDDKAIEGAEGKRRLVSALYSSNPLSEVRALIPEMKLDWGGVKTQTGKLFRGEEAKKSLEEAIRFFMAPDDFTGALHDYLVNEEKGQLKAYLDRVASLGEISFECNSRGTNKKRKNAMWLLKFFPDDFSVGLIKTIISEKEKIVDTPEGGDPIKLSRGERGYVFKPFSPWRFYEVWKDFDMAAFGEALKTINQFRSKTEERRAELGKYEDAISWMEGKSTRKPTAYPDSDDGIEDESDEAALPILSGDPRWEALQKLLSELAISNDFTENELVDYGLSPKTLRGYSQLRKLFFETEEKARKADADDKRLSEKLLEAVTRFQSAHSDSMGSADLFRKLTKPEYFRIWHDCDPDGRFASNDILGDAVRYFSYQAAAERLKEPIQITPADPKYSRRTSDFRALAYDKNKGYQKGFGHIRENAIAVRAAVKRDGVFRKTTLVLEYSAPRLRRDGLIGKEFSIYYPPALQALLPETDAPRQDFKSTSVSLMPDWDKDGKIRILLNFSTKIDVGKLYAKSDHRFGRQFYRVKDANTCLLWPSYGRKQESTWHHDPAPFDVLAVDLGQRTAGALSRITVSTEKRPHSVLVGSADGVAWYAYRKYSELLRLPGEDAMVLRNGRRTRELSGAEGRPADKEETRNALQLCIELCGNKQMLLDAEDKPYRSFPRQNDRLLKAFGQAAWRVKRLHRWLWMSKDEKQAAKIESEMRDCDWLPVKTIEAARLLCDELRRKLPEILVQIADRVLPLRGRHWRWEKRSDGETFVLMQTERGLSDPHRKICGQRGLSFARIEQLESMRIRCQSLNRLLMHRPGDKPATPKEMRDRPIPDCCPDILRRLDAMKEQRVNQTANMILAQALGLRHRTHETPAEDRERSGIHGEYEKIPGVSPAAFIVLENLSRYRFSQERSPHENSKLMKWSHRQILDKLKLLCEVFNIPVLEVNPSYSSKFTPDLIPGFRADEYSPEQLKSLIRWSKFDDPRKKQRVDEIDEILRKMTKIDARSTAILPRVGGPIFVPIFVPDIPAENNDTLVQADINASFNIGLRGIADGTDLHRNNRLSAERKSGTWKVKRSYFVKMVYKKDIHISYEPEKKPAGRGGNFFVIGCDPDYFADPSRKTPAARPEFADPGLKRRYPHLMFGSEIWRNELLQLDRCHEINSERLRKLKERN